MTLSSLVSEVFASDGLLARQVPEFIPRAGQADMARAIAAQMDVGGALVVEAGTGIGKTFAYLVPALLSGHRVLLSTATKTLQDQLYSRDLPRLVDILGVPLQTALLKGRSSYLCLHRLGIARQAADTPAPTLVTTLGRVERWAQSTQTGDLSELAGLDERSEAVPLVTSTRENCLGVSCPQWGDCHVNVARRRALAADVVVINHHLFFADMAVRESGVAELLPLVNTVIFDEAHQLNDIGVQFLGQQLSSGQLLDFGRDMQVAGQQHARGAADWLQWGAAIEHQVRELRMLLGRWPAATKLHWAQASPQEVDAIKWSKASSNLANVLQQVQHSLHTLADSAPDLKRLAQRADQLLERLQTFRVERTTDADTATLEDNARWVDVGTGFNCVQVPLDIAQTVQTRLLAPVAGEPGTAGQGARRTWVFTSATLGDDAQLKWFTEPCGLQDATILRIASPFDYANQAVWYVPSELPLPSDPGHSEQVAAFVADAAQRLNGRTLVLTTSLRALQLISAALCADVATHRCDVLVQGQQGKRELIERFQQGPQPGGRGCILVASASFWEGVDLPGEALQLVVIDKLPFPAPGDPLADARTRRLQAQGRSVFNTYAMPEAAMALRQGAGRLIRRESDRGALAICDTRLTSSGYGKRLIKALPPMRRVKSAQEWAAALLALTRTSTKDLTSV